MFKILIVILAIVAPNIGQRPPSLRRKCITIATIPGPCQEFQTDYNKCSPWLELHEVRIYLRISLSFCS